MYTRKTAIHLLIALALVLGLVAALPAGSVKAAATTIYVDNLAPSWTAPGGGGVFSAYVGPDAYGFVSPGATALYDGREAGIIKAGINVDADHHYWDEGLFAFIPNVTIDQFAAGPVSFDVETQAGVNPVWMTIEIDTGVAGDRSDNTIYQHVPTTNPAGWHTVDGVAGLWQKWNNNNGDVSGNPLISLADVAAAHSGLNVVRAYLRLGMGDSYNNGGTGTIAWVDKVTLGEVTYDFVTAKYWYVSPAGLDTNEGTEASPFLTIQHAIDAAAAGDTIHVLAGTYTGNVTVNKAVTLQGPGINHDFSAAITVGDTQAPGVWYTDRYRPAVFEVADLDGRTALKHGVRIADSAANRPPAYSGTFYNNQGRKLDTTLSGPKQTMSIDLWVDPAWAATLSTAGLWSTGFDVTGGISAYPVIAWQNNGTDAPGFYSFDYIHGGYQLLKAADAGDYGRWHTISFTLNVGVGVEYFVDGVSKLNFADPDTLRLENVILNVYNFGADYDVYWDNFATYDAQVVGQITISSNDVKLDGIDLSNPGQTYGVLIGSGLNNIQITHNRIHDIGSPSLAANVKGVYFPNGADNVLIEGNIFSNLFASTKSVNGVNSGDSNSTDPNQGLIIRDNTFTNISSATKGGYGILLNNGAGAPGAVIEDNTFSNISGGWTHAIGLEGPSLNALVDHNIFSGLTASSADNSAVFFEANPVGGSVLVTNNQFLHTGFGVAIHPTNAGGVYTVNASPNWWGSINGPTAASIGGSAVSSPWCGDPECTFFLQATGGVFEIPAGTPGNQVQMILDAIPAGSTVKFLGSTGSLAGGYWINHPNLTIILADGTVIQNNSPCFVVNADYTTIKAETIGGAQCVPTGGDNGIDVLSPRTDLTVEGIEFVGTAGTDGIHFAGAITDMVIVDNYFHNLGGAGIFFAAQPAGVIDIHGNMFKNNIGNGIEAGSFIVPAEYNSWGNIAGAASPAGDGISTGVDAEPWTHVDLYMASSGTPWASQVVSGQTITYTVYGNLHEAFAADFSLVYPANLTLDSTALGGTFDILSVIDTTIPGIINFHGVGTGYAAQSGTAMPIFSATFTAGAPVVAAPMNLDEATDGFGMDAGYASSTNIYADTLLDNTVTIIALPTLASTDLPGYYLTGDPQEFHVTLTNPGTGGSFSNVLINFRIAGAIPADLSLEYFEVMDGTWKPLPLTPSGADLIGTYGPPAGFPIIPGYTATSAFRVTASTAKSYPVTITLNDLNSTPANFELASLAQTAVVYTKPVITSANLVGPYLVGIAQDFTLNITNASPIPAPFDLVLTFPAGTTIVYGGTTYTCDATGCTIPVSLPSPSNDLTFSVTFAAPYSGDITANLYDSDWLPTDRLLATFTQAGVTAYANFAVTGTFSMQGRSTRAGIPVTLTATLVPYGPFTANTTAAITNNLSYAHVAEGTYRVTTNQPRYLNVTADLLKDKAVSASALVITTLELKGGNAVWQDFVGGVWVPNTVINVNDASQVGGDYGHTGSTFDGDVNFSGKVDVFDLALVGGNFDLTSANAYVSWLP